MVEHESKTANGEIATKTSDTEATRGEVSKSAEFLSDDVKRLDEKLTTSKNEVQSPIRSEIRQQNKSVKSNFNATPVPTNLMGLMRTVSIKEM